MTNENDTSRDNLDIEAALASVSSLSDAVAEHEAAEAAEQARFEAGERAREEAERRREAYYFPHPSPVKIRRGQLGSVIPAVALIVIGAWLTFALSSDTPPDTTTILPMVMGGLGISLLGYWLSSERWSSGALFGALTILCVGGSLIYLSQADAANWPVLIAAIGVSMILTAILSPGIRQIFFAGMLFVVAGLAALTVTTGQLNTTINDTILQIGPFVLIAIAVILLLPLLLSRRSR